MDEVQKLYEEYIGLGYSRNTAISQMRLAGTYDDEALKAMAALYSGEPKKKSADSGASASSSGEVSMGYTSNGAMPQGQAVGDSDSPVDEEFQGVNRDVVEDYINTTNFNIPAYLMQGEPSTDIYSLSPASVKTPDIKINVSGFLNGNSDPLFAPLLSYSQSYHLNNWFRETANENGLGDTMDKWGERLDLSNNYIEVIEDMARESILPQSVREAINNGASLRKAVNDNLLDAMKSSMVNESREDFFFDTQPTLSVRSKVFSTLKNQLRDKAEEYNSKFNDTFSNKFLEEITNKDFVEKDEEGNFTPTAKANLRMLETSLLKEYGLPVDLTKDGVYGERVPFWDYIWKRGKKGSISVGNGIMNVLDAVGVYNIGGETDARKEDLFWDSSTNSFIDGSEYGRAWNEWTQKIGEARMLQLDEQITQYTTDFKGAVKNNEWGQALTQMFGATAEGWPYLVPFLFTKSISPWGAVGSSVGLGIMTEASAIRNDFTFDDFVKDGKTYNYYEAAEAAGTDNIQKIMSEFDVVENDLARAGYLAQKAFGDMGVAWAQFRALKGLKLPEAKNFLSGYAKGLGVAMTENSLAIAAATMNAEFARNNFTGRDTDAFEVIDNAIWTSIEHAGTSALLFNLGTMKNAATRAFGDNNALSTVLNPQQSMGKATEAIRRAMASLESATTQRSRLEALAVLNNLQNRRNILYRQNNDWMNFLRKQDKKNGTNLFGETADILNTIEFKKHKYSLTNDPNLRLIYKDDVAKLMDNLMGIYKNNQKEFYTSIGAARGVGEREIQRSIIGENPSTVAELLLRLGPQTKPRPLNPVPVEDIVQTKARVAGDIEARMQPEWMIKNVEEASKSDIDRARLEEILKSEDFAILTGEFPPLEMFGEKENAAAQENARAFLDVNGLKYHEVTGRFDSKGEKSFLVESMPEDLVIKFLNEFGQHSAVRQRGIVKRNGDYANQEGLDWSFGEGVTDKTNNTSVIKLSDGEVVQFSRDLDGFRNKKGEVIEEGGFWDMDAESKAAQTSPPAEVPIEYESNGFKSKMHRIRNTISRALDYAFAFRFGSYKDARGKKVKLNDKDVIETYRSLKSVKGAVDETTQGDLYNYNAVFKMFVGKDLVETSRTPAKDKSPKESIFAKLLTGEINIDDPRFSNFSAEEKAAIRSLRQNIDGLSDRLIEILRDRPISNDAEGKALMDLINTIQQNKGVYLTRSWELFTDGGKRLDMLMQSREAMPPDVRKAFDDAVRFEASQIEDPTQAEANVRKYLQDLVALKDFNGNVNILAAMQNGMLKARNNAIPEPFQNLFGKIQDPHYQYFATISKLRSYIANYEWQNTMAQALLESGLGRIGNEFVGEESPLGLYDKMVPTAQPWEPLYQVTIPKQLKSVFDNMAPLKTWDSMLGKGVGGFADLWSRASALGKINHTVLAPTATLRNFWSGNFLQIAAGHHWLMNPEKVFDAIAMSWPTKAMLGKSQLPSAQPWMAERNKLVKLRVLGESVNATDLMRNMQDLIGQDYRKTFANDNKTWEFFKRMYAFGDDFYKVMGFYQERSMLMDSGMLLEDAEILAANRVRNIYPTYSNISRGAVALRRFPYKAPFVSFPYEVVRNTKNTLLVAAEDMAAGRKDMAVQRILGLISAGLMIDALHEVSMDVIGFDDEDDEAIRLLGPEWQRLAKLMYLGIDEKTGNPSFIDLSYTFPQEVIMKPVRAITGGDPTSDGYYDNVSKAIEESLAPYTGSDMFTGTIESLLKNTDEYGRQIIKTYGDQDPLQAMLEDPSLAADGLQFIFDSYAPGMVKGNMIDFLRSAEPVSEDNPWYEIQYEFQKRYPKETRYRSYNFSDAFAQLAGFRESELSLDPGGQSAFYQMQADIIALEMDHERRVLKTSPVPTEDIENTAKRFISKHKNVCEQAMRISNAVKKLSTTAGWSEDETEDRIMTLLTRGGFSQNAAFDIYQGKIPDLKGFTAANWNKIIEPIIEDRLMSEEEKAEMEMNLERNAEIYNQIIFDWNDSNYDRFYEEQKKD